MSGVAFQEHSVAISAGGVAVAVIRFEEYFGQGLVDSSDFAVPGIYRIENLQVGKNTLLHGLWLQMPSVFCDYQWIF